MDDDFLAAAPGVLDDRRLADVERLLDHVEFAQRIDAAPQRQGVEPLLVPVAHVLDVADPVVGKADAPVVERRGDAAAVRVADDDDVLDLQDIGGELDHRQAVQVGMDDDVGDVAVHEQLARRQVDEFVRRHAAVGAADPEVARRLLLQQPGEEARLARLGLLAPSGGCCPAVPRDSST